MAAGPLPLRAPCTGAGGPLRARPAAEVSTFCSCGVAIFSQRKKRVAVGLTLVMLPACHCAQRAHPGLCHGLRGTTAWGNNLSREGRGSTACHALRKGRKWGKNFHIFAFSCISSWPWNSGGTEGQGGRSCPLCFAVVLKPACAGAFPAG